MTSQAQGSAARARLRLQTNGNCRFVGFVARVKGVGGFGGGGGGVGVGISVSHPPIPPSTRENTPPDIMTRLPLTPPPVRGHVCSTQLAAHVTHTGGAARSGAE